MKNRCEIYDKTSKKWIPVTESVHKAYCQEIDIFRRKEQRRGHCKCPCSKWWTCDCDCLICEFYIGSEFTQKWVNTSKKDCWTDEYRAKASEYRKNHPINRPDITCFTSKIKCVRCGCNFRRSTQSSTKSSDGKRHYWRCAERNGCDTVGLREDFLKPFLAKVLGINEFDDDIFKEGIDHIEVLSTTDLTI